MGALDDAVEIARRIAPIAISGPGAVTAEAIRGYQRMSGLLRALEAAERDMAATYGNLVRLRDKGLIAKHDVQAYDILRANLFNAELSVYNWLVSAVARINRDMAAQLPAPQLMPGLGRPRKTRRLRDPYPLPKPFGYATGGRAVAAEGGEAPAPPASPALSGIQLWVAGAILALVGLGLWTIVAVLFLEEATDGIARVVAVKAQVALYKDMTAARERVYKECIQAQTRQYEACVAAAGDDPSVCAEILERLDCIEQAGFLIPTPREAGIDPAAIFDTEDKYKWIVWTAVVMIVGTGGFLFFKSDTGRGALRRVTGGRWGRGGGGGGRWGRGRQWRIDEGEELEGLGRQALPKPGGPHRVRDLDGPSTYDLEVE